MNSIDRLDPEVVDAVRAAIVDADGQEVLCVGRVGSDGIVESIVIAARGNESAVPALLNHMEKGDVAIHNHPSGYLRPSEADLSVASRLGSIGIGFYIVDNFVDRVYVVAEPVILKEITPLDVDELRETLEPNGGLSRFVEGYEPRESQIDLLDRVGNSFNESGICVAEAGTGVGKSMAYLLPAIRWAQQNDERVVVSTATINLQQQLVEKDIPLALKVLGADVKAALVKGRGNYLCLKKLSEASEEESLFEEPDEALKVIRQWAETTPTGGRSELPSYVADEVWSRVSAEADGCMALRCRHREKCFVLKSRREAAAAQLLVVNHHLLFSDLSLRIGGAGFENTAVLPPFQRLIFDEAHNMERSATSYFSESMNKFAVGKFLSRLVRRKRGRTLGVINALRKLAGSQGEAEVDRLEPLVQAVRERVDVLDAEVLIALGGDGNRRFAEAPDTETRRHILEPLHEVHDALLGLVTCVQSVLERLSDADLEGPDAYEARIIRQRLEDFASLCHTFPQFDEIKDRVFWIERRVTSGGEAFAQLVISPLDLSAMMREAVFEPYETVVCTSATLTVKGDFSFWLSRVGLTGFDRRVLRTVSLPSPFPYKERVLLGVPSDAPEPTQEEAYRRFVSDFAFRTLEISEGHGLVLFTSYAMLKDVHAEIAPRLNARGITVFKQGDDDRARILSRFTADIASVLFATDSFWEGIDAPGETLKIVILCRLPFRVPTDPVVAARMEAIDRAGGNSFIEYALPGAVMRLKQGFGRLMRRATDGGAVLILDSRIVKKFYGPLFLGSLPETQTSVKHAAGVLSDLENFLYR